MAVAYSALQLDPDDRASPLLLLLVVVFPPHRHLLCEYFKDGDHVIGAQAVHTDMASGTSVDRCPELYRVLDINDRLYRK